MHRSLFRAHFVACVLTLGLGIAASTAIFTLIYSLLLRPLPFADPDRLVAMEQPVAWGDILEFERHSRTLAAEAAYRGRTWGFTDDSPSPVEVVLSGQITRGFFDTLKVHPQLGSAFTPADEAPGANRIIWLTDDFWQRRYDRNPQIVGRTMRLNNMPHRVAGVLPSGFQFSIDGETPDIYVPLDRADYCCSRDVRILSGIARLSPGASRAAASAEMTALSVPTHFDAIKLQSALLGRTWERSLFFLALASTLLMLVASTNAAAILLARAVRTLRDVAIKASLGADFGRLIREQAAHGFLVGLAAAVFGICLGTASLRLAKLVPVFAAVLGRYSSIAPLRMNYAVAGVASLLAVVSALAATLAPVWLIRKMNLDAILRRGASGSKSAIRVRNALVVLQIAASFVLLAVGASVLDQLQRTIGAGHGFRTSQIFVSGIGIPEIPYDTDQKVIDVHERILRRLAAIPGVTGAAGGTGIPFGRRTRFQPPGENLSKKDQPLAAVATISPGLLDLLDIPVLEGRGFDSSDRTGHPLVALVNRKFADRYHTRVGTRLRVSKEFEVIGIVGDARNQAIDAPPEPEFFFATLQFPLDGCLYFIRSSLPASTLAEPIRQAVWSVDPHLERLRPRPLAAYIERDLESRRLALWLCACFGTVALFLAVAGLWASLSTWVTESQREIAIRSALGEPSRQTAWRVVSTCLRLAAAGGILGLFASLASTALLKSGIDGFQGLNAKPLVIVGIVIGSSALFASALPARRAARCNPIELLKED